MNTVINYIIFLYVSKLGAGVPMYPNYRAGADPALHLERTVEFQILLTREKGVVDETNFLLTEIILLIKWSGVENI